MAAAQLTNNLSELIIHRSAFPGAYRVIERAQGVPLFRKWWSSSGDEDGRDVCYQVSSVFWFNLGMLRSVGTNAPYLEMFGLNYEPLDMIERTVVCAVPRTLARTCPPTTHRFRFPLVSVVWC